MVVRIQSEPFDHGAEVNSFCAGRTDIGAMVSFAGIVRDGGGSRLSSMMIEHYPGMTEDAIGRMVAETRNRWQVADCLVIHRYGNLVPGEHIMMVATLAKHRAEAFEAAAFLMDYLKTRAPFWKKEFRGGHGEWVGGREEDELALQRWNRP